MKAYQLGLPAYVFLSFCSATGVKYRYSPGAGIQETHPLGRETVAFPEGFADDYDVDVATLLRPAFNVVWNAFGFRQCDAYDGQGVLRRPG